MLIYHTRLSDRPCHGHKDLHCKHSNPKSSTGASATSASPVMLQEQARATLSPEQRQ
jgi:hypothetical protein